MKAHNIYLTKYFLVPELLMAKVSSKVPLMLQDVGLNTEFWIF